MPNCLVEAIQRSMVASAYMSTTLLRRAPSGRLSGSYRVTRMLPASNSEIRISCREATDRRARGRVDAWSDASSQAEKQFRWLGVVFRCSHFQRSMGKSLMEQSAEPDNLMRGLALQFAAGMVGSLSRLAEFFCCARVAQVPRTWRQFRLDIELVDGCVGWDPWGYRSSSGTWRPQQQSTGYLARPSEQF